MPDQRTRQLPRGTTVRYPGDPGYIGTDPRYFDGNNDNGEIFVDPRTGQTYVNQPTSTFNKVLPYAIAAGMAAPHVLAAFGVGGAAGAGTGGAAGAAGGAGTAGGAGAATTAATGAAMRARDWIDLLIFGGDTLGNIWSTRQQVNAADRNAEANLQANREAVQLLRDQWEQSRRDFEPYLRGGHAAVGRLDRMLGEMPDGPALPANLSQFAQGGYDPQTYRPRAGWTAPAPTPRPTPPPAPVKKDLDYWAARGMSPIGENGQLAPGWRRTADGYEYDGTPANNTGTPSGAWSGGFETGPGPRIDGPPRELAPGVMTTNPAPTSGDQQVRMRVPGALTMAQWQGGGAASAPQPAADEIVLMEAPTGERMPVHRTRVAFFESKGAKRVAA